MGASIVFVVASACRSSVEAISADVVVTHKTHTHGHRHLYISHIYFRTCLVSATIPFLSILWLLSLCFYLPPAASASRFKPTDLSSRLYPAAPLVHHRVHIASSSGVQS